MVFFLRMVYGLECEGSAMVAKRIVGRSATSHALTIAQIKERIAQADEKALEALERAYASDSRKGVQQALKSARSRLDAQAFEIARVRELYACQDDLARSFLVRNNVSIDHEPIIVGLDEVGRGPLAGPLAVGAVVLPRDGIIEDLNDSKKIAPEKREFIADAVKSEALAWSIQYIEPAQIDACGMSASLVVAFRRAIADIEDKGIVPDVVLLDGNPMHLDPREVNVIKGDGRCASIAAASIIAKVERDALMCRYAKEYPQYHFDACKGYHSEEHAKAIREYGLSPIHRKSFCTAFLQETLF